MLKVVLKHIGFTVILTLPAIVWKFVYDTSENFKAAQERFFEIMPLLSTPVKESFISAKQFLIIIVIGFILNIIFSIRSFDRVGVKTYISLIFTLVNIILLLGHLLMLLLGR